MKKLKLEKLESKHKFFKGFKTLTRAFLYIPGCMLIGWTSSIIFEPVWVMIFWTFAACLTWDTITRFLWGKAQKKAKKIEQEIEEYAETEQGEKEVVLLANIESIQEIIKDKDCKIKEPCERLLKKLLETKYKMANPPRAKFKDEDTGEVFYGEVVDDNLMDDMEQAIDEMANECGLDNVQEG